MRVFDGRDSYLRTPVDERDPTVTVTYAWPGVCGPPWPGRAREGICTDGGLLFSTATSTGQGRAPPSIATRGALKGLRAPS